MQSLLNKILLILAFCLSIATWSYAAPSIYFDSASSSAPESITNARVDIMLSEPSSDTVSVQYDITGVTAEEGSDFSGGSGVVTFSPGETRKTLSFTIQDDNVNEADETVQIFLSDPVNAELGQPSIHSYTIEDDDPIEVNFTAERSGDEEDNRSVSIGLQLSGPSEQTVTVYYITGGSASPSFDYEPLSGQVVFEPGSVQASIELTIKDDENVEGNENVELILDKGENVSLGSARTFTYTIYDNDPPVPYVSFTSKVNTVLEDSGYADVDVALSEPTDKQVTVEYFVSDNSTASPGVDYRLNDGTLTFEPGQVHQTIQVEILNDDQNTADKSIVIGLRNPSNADIGDTSQHTLWRIDDDQPFENQALFKQEIPSRFPPRMLVIVGPKATTINPGGIAVDDYGNLYITDQGPDRGENQGSVLMWPKGLPYVIRILENVGLTRPGDIELSNDQKALIVADPTGVHRFPLGLSIRFTNINPFRGNTVVHVFSSTGEKVARVSPDGYFHIPGLLVPGQGPSVEVVIEHDGQTKRQTLFLGQPGKSGGLFGHTVVNLEF